MEKNGKTKNIVLAVLLVAVLTLSIAYATLSAQLNISAQATVKNGQWNVQFQQKTGDPTPAICTATSGGSATTASIVSGHEGTLTSTEFSGLQVEFKVPGDKVVCTWDVANNGTIDAKLATYNAPTVTLSGTDASTLNGKVLTTLKVANATPQVGDELPATSGNVKTVELTIQLDPNLETLPSSDVTATVGSSTFTYQQK